MVVTSTKSHTMDITVAVKLALLCAAPAWAALAVFAPDLNCVFSQNAVAVQVQLTSGHSRDVSHPDPPSLSDTQNQELLSFVADIQSDWVRKFQRDLMAMSEESLVRSSDCEWGLNQATGVIGKVHGLLTRVRGELVPQLPAGDALDGLQQAKQEYAGLEAQYASLTGPAVRAALERFRTQEIPMLRHVRRDIPNQLRYMARQSSAVEAELANQIEESKSGPEVWPWILKLQGSLRRILESGETFLRADEELQNLCKAGNGEPSGAQRARITELVAERKAAAEQGWHKTRELQHVQEQELHRLQPSGGWNPNGTKSQDLQFERNATKKLRKLLRKVEREIRNESGAEAGAQAVTIRALNETRRLVLFEAVAALSAKDYADDVLQRAKAAAAGTITCLTEEDSVVADARSKVAATAYRAAQKALLPVTKALARVRAPAVISAGSANVHQDHVDCAIKKVIHVESEIHGVKRTYEASRHAALRAGMSRPPPGCPASAEETGWMKDGPRRLAPLAAACLETALALRREDQGDGHDQSVSSEIAAENEMLLLAQHEDANKAYEAVKQGQTEQLAAETRAMQDGRGGGQSQSADEQGEQQSRAGTTGVGAGQGQTQVTFLGFPSDSDPGNAEVRKFSVDRDELQRLTCAASGGAAGVTASADSSAPPGQAETYLTDKVLEQLAYQQGLIPSRAEVEDEAAPWDRAQAPQDGGHADFASTQILHPANDPRDALRTLRLLEQLEGPGTREQAQGSPSCGPLTPAELQRLQRRGDVFESAAEEDTGEAVAADASVSTRCCVCQEELQDRNSVADTRRAVIRIQGYPQQSFHSNCLARQLLTRSAQVPVLCLDLRREFLEAKATAKETETA